MAPDFRSVAWSIDADDKHANGSIIIQDVDTENVISTFAPEASGVRVKAHSTDGRYLAIAIYDATGWSNEYDEQWSLHILDLQRRSVVQKIPNLSRSARTYVRFSPDGLMIAVATMNNVKEDRDACKLSAWSVQTGNLIDSWNISNGMVWDFAFSPDSSLIAAGLETEPSWRIFNQDVDISSREKTARGEVRVWDLQTRQLRARWEVSEYYDEQLSIWGVTALAFKPDGTTLAIGASNGAIRFYQVPNGTPESTIAEK